MMTSLGSLRTYARWARRRWRRFSRSQRGKTILKRTRQLVTAAVLGYLVYRMADIGWENVVLSLPRTPWFYIIFGGIFFVQPVTQALIYQKIWPTSFRSLLPATLVKRVYDKEVLSYSGDVYLYTWARKALPLPSLEIFHGIKDNAILSSIASTGIAFGLLAFFVMSGIMPLPDAVQNNIWMYVIGTVFILVILIAVGVQIRKSVFKLPGRILGLLLGLHAGRILLAQALQITAWMVVEPEVPVEIWFAFLAVQIMTGRIPLLPSKDLIFVAIGIEMAGTINLDPALIAGLLGMQSVIDKSTNVTAFAIFTTWQRWKGTTTDLDTEGFKAKMEETPNDTAAEDDTAGGDRAASLTTEPEEA